jgi:hypothetical protein
MTSARAWAFVASSVASVVIACSGGGGSIGGGGPVTSFPEGQDVASLSPADQQTLCDDVRRYLQERITPETTKPFGCAFTGWAAALSASRTQQDPRAACQRAYDDCLARPAADGQSVTVTELGRDCNVSRCRGVLVGDYAGCAREVVDAIGSYSFSCDMAASADAGTAPVPSFTAGAACQRVQSSCSEQ